MAIVTNVKQTGYIAQGLFAALSCEMQEKVINALYALQTEAAKSTNKLDSIFIQFIQEVLF
jgi:hypothetical protein